jgi:serine/threonine protein kinase
MPPPRAFSTLAFILGISKDRMPQMGDSETHIPRHETTGSMLRAVMPHRRFSDHYHLQKILGEGGMGRIYSARDMAIGRNVAIKFLRRELVAGISLRYFLKEAQITGQLAHPNIVPVYEIGSTDDGDYFYAMKEVQGENLGTILDRLAEGHAETLATYNLQVLIGILLKTCDAVAYAHNKGVVHLDLKPENIMVGAFGEVLVMDWGLARLRRLGPRVDPAKMVHLDDEAHVDASHEDGKVLGTPAFMAPEQASGNASVVGTRSDIYSLGGILYNILVLRPPASGRTTTAVIRKKFTEGVRDPLVYNRQANSEGADHIHLNHLPDAQVPESLAAVALKALAESPDARYQKVNELQRDLIAYLAGYAPKAEQAGRGKILRLYLHRNRRFLSYSLVLVLSLLASVLVGAVLVTNLENNRDFDNAHELLRASRLALDNGDLRLGESLARQALENGAYQGMARRALILALLQRQKIDEARKLAQVALAEDLPSPWMKTLTESKDPMLLAQSLAEAGEIATSCRFILPQVRAVGMAGADRARLCNLLARVGKVPMEVHCDGQNLSAVLGPWQLQSRPWPLLLLPPGSNIESSDPRWSSDAILTQGKLSLRLMPKD